MRLKTFFLVIAATVVHVGKGFTDEGKDDKNAAESLQGEWIVLSLGFGGYELKGTVEHPMKIVFTKDRIMFRPTFRIHNTSKISFGLNGMKTEHSTDFSISENNEEGIFRLNPNKSPAWIDVKQGDKEGPKGIYRLKQDDLEICIPRFATSKRPEKFTNSHSATLYRLKRAAKKE